MVGTIIKIGVTVKSFLKKTPFLLVFFLFFFGDIYEILVKTRKFCGERFAVNIKEIYDSSISKKRILEKVAENIFWYKKPSKILNSS